MAGRFADDRQLANKQTAQRFIIDLKILTIAANNSPGYAAGKLEHLLQQRFIPFVHKSQPDDPAQSRETGG